MAGSNSVSHAANAAPLPTTQGVPLEDSLQSPLSAPHRAKLCVGDGHTTEALSADSDAVRPEILVALQKLTTSTTENSFELSRTLDDDEEEFVDPEEFDGASDTEFELSRTLDDDEEEFVDAEGFDGASDTESALAKPPTNPQVGAHPVGRELLRRGDALAVDSSEVSVSPEESVHDPVGDDVHSEGQLVKVGTGEESAKVRQEIEVQQGWMWSALQRVGGMVGAAVTSIDSYFNPDLYAAEAAEDFGSASVSEPKGKGARGRAAVASAETVAQKTEARMRELNGKVELAFAKLNQQLIEKYQMPELALPQKAGRVDVPLTLWDNLTRMGHRAVGLGSAGVSTVGQVGMAAMLPSVANIFSVGVTARMASMAGGLWLGLRALADMPNQANATAAESHMNSELATVKPMLDELKSLMALERQRQAGGNKSMLVSLEREQQIHELERERFLLENALARAESDEMEMGDFLEHPVALGSGESREEALNQSQRDKSFFQSFISSIGEVFSSFIGFLSYLPNIFVSDAARRDAARSEDAYLAAYRDAFRELSSRAKKSGIDLKADPVTRMRQDGYGKDEIVRRHKEVCAQLYRGENIQRLISGNAQVAFGQLIVVSEDAPDIKHSVPASLSMARDLASYFSLMADKDADDLGFEVARNEDGSLTVADPKGQLYNFLMSVPSSYTSEMAGANGRGALANLTIDDPSAGFPGGARSMRFERALQLDSYGKPVLNAQGEFVSSMRVAFLADQPQRIYAPLANEGHTLRSVVVLKHLAELEGLEGSLTEPEAVAIKEFARMAPEKLEERLKQVNQSLEQNRVLLQVEQEQFKALQDWEVRA